MQQQLEKEENKGKEEQYIAQMPVLEEASEEVLEEEIICGTRTKSAKEGLFPPLIVAIIIFPTLFFLFRNLFHNSEYSLFITFSVVLFSVFIILFSILDWFYRWIRTDKENISWQNIFKKKQFARWEDVSDYYMEIPKIVLGVSTHVMPPKSVVIFRDGRKLSLIPEVGVLTPTTHLHKRIMEKAINAPIRSWEMQGIRSQEDWEYTYTLTDTNQTKQRISIFCSLLMISILPIFMYQMIANRNVPDSKSLVLTIIFSTMITFIGGLFILGHHLDRFSKILRLKAFRKTQITVNREGLSWTNAEGNGSAKWEQVIALRREGIITSGKMCYVVSLAGKEETEVRFPGALIFRDYAHPRKRRIPLETVIQMYGMGAKNKTIEQKEDMLSTATPQSAYPIAGAKVYSYNTLSMREAKKRIPQMTLFIPLISFAFYKDISKIFPIGFIYFSATVATLYIIIILCISKLLNNFINSQIELDDLGIAHVTSKGVKWRLPWLSIVKHECEVGKAIVLTARDGKTYKFSPGMARMEEMNEEIKQRVAQNNPQYP
jgi:hypothetical protein